MSGYTPPGPQPPPDGGTPSLDRGKKIAIAVGGGVVALAAITAFLPESEPTPVPADAEQSSTQTTARAPTTSRADPTTTPEAATTTPEAAVTTPPAGQPPPPQSTTPFVVPSPPEIPSTSPLPLPTMPDTSYPTYEAPTFTTPELTPYVPPPPAPPSSVYYENCDAVREAGAAPLFIGQDGYDASLDRDGDGVACEWTG
ncbi:excalibur calcium-binding domain-containing protein [Rhodococcus sp. HNM0569]|uniref:excalibur calcium-binding domain-containing protein n=1 Tax=Rhodococcus sp. HNM0569 TaxID=2716340 RepID=UPI00146DEBBE|nr:excalibur calcium-binding domain-containing protein [Rhodococcus sp. HNM0569]NLU83627.1 excalibur calcium-binding domain-containing protein [Rhodococcus sp. HNM0569]